MDIVHENMIFLIVPLMSCGVALIAWGWPSRSEVQKGPINLERIPSSFGNLRVALGFLLLVGCLFLRHFDG